MKNPPSWPARLFAMLKRQLTVAERRYGSCTTGVPSSHFRNDPETGRKFKPLVSTLCATLTHAPQQTAPHSITSSARAITRAAH